MAGAADYHIVTIWTAAAAPAEVAAVLTDPAAFPRWWGEVYLHAAVVAPGDARGIGRRVEVLSRGWLPYRLRWTGELVAADLPWRWTIRATGDLTGVGVWTLTPRGGTTEAVFDWRVRADRRLLRALSPLLQPLFAWNHRWAMARGAAALPAEIARRRGGTAPGMTVTAGQAPVS
jgi:hypothetical protein